MIVFPNTVSLVAKWCNEALVEDGADWRVYHMAPRELPDRFVKLTRVGGVRMPNEVYDKAIVLVQAYGPTEQSAYELCAWVRGRIDDLSFRMVDGYQVSKVDELGGPQHDVDRDAKIPYYHYTTQVPVRGKAA